MPKMNQVHIRDINFFSEKYPERPCECFEWVWDRNQCDNHVTVFTDQFLHEAESSKSAHKVAVLFEPPTVSPEIYDFAAKHHTDFDYVCTFSDDLSGKENFLFYPYGTTWVHEGERGIHQKSKLLSIIASNKRFTYGQRLRHELVSRHRDRINGLYGNGYQPIKDKIEGLQDFMYSIAMENCDMNSYFSEKLMDCFLTGTIPIYWGFSRVSEFFDPNGIITFNNVDEVEEILDSLSPDDYQSRMKAVEYNYHKAYEYIDFEKHLWEGCLKRFFV